MAGSSFLKKDSGKEELEFQKVLIASVVAAGGFGRKISHPQQHGIPDTLLFLPGFAPVTVECKDLGYANNRFCRKLDVTAKQSEFMTKANEVYFPHRAAFVAVKAIIDGRPMVAFVPPEYTVISATDFTHNIHRVGKVDLIVETLEIPWLNLGAMRVATT